MPKPSLQCRSALAALLLVATVPGPAPGAPGAAPDAQASALERTLLPAAVVEGVPPWTLADRMRHYHVPGVSIALIDGGKIAWVRGYGVVDAASKTPVTPQTLFQAASLSKPVTAMAVLRLADQGKLSLTAPVNSLLRSWKLPEGPFTPKVTLERILSHSAGLTVAGFAGYPPGATLPTLLETLNGRPPANNKPVRAEVEPGTAFRYSGGGYEVAQQVLADVTGQPFGPFMQETILGPVGMQDSVFQEPLGAELAARAATGHDAEGAPLPGKWHVYPELAAAGLCTTPSDLARFVIAVQKAHAGAPGALLSKAMASRMLTVASVGDLGIALGNGLGLFIDQRGKGTFAHVSMEQPGGAEGFRALLVASTEGGYGLVVMTNADGGSKLADEIARGAAEVYGWKALAVPPLKRAHPSEEQMKKFVGRYRVGSDEVLTITVGHGALRAQPILSEPFDLFPVEGGDFVRQEPPTHYAFDAAGLVTKNLFEDRTGLRVTPGDTTPLELLLAGKVDRALAGYRRLKDLDSTDPSISELRLNELGYELQATSKDKALVIFRLNAELYPQSPNTWDSLAEALLAAGKREEALRCYRKVLETVPRDTHLPSQLKTSLLHNAEQRVRELQGS
jgi:CubicO group peptidase (beta-lactamase class C family)